MRILLDENLDWRLRRDLPGHQVESVPLLGWAGIQNGELLRKGLNEARCSCIRNVSEERDSFGKWTPAVEPDFRDASS